MKQKQFLLKLLPGFIPLLVFIIVDELWGTEAGLVAAIVLGGVELVWYLIREKRLDKFILFDTLLIIILGVVSLILENEVFFKLKPALIGVLMCLVLGVSAFTPMNFLLSMSRRYMRDIEINDLQYQMMKRSMKVLFWLFTGYTVLVFYSVWFMTKEAWAFISGGLFYIAFIGYFVFEFVKGRIKLNRLHKEEWLPLLNEKGEVVGKAPRSICHSDKKYLHPVVHLHLFNSKGELFLQKRPMHKIQPGKWDTAVGGHIAFGEDVEKALKREAFEELGIENFHADLIANYIWESDIEREYVFCFVVRYDKEIAVNHDELSDGRFWSRDEVSMNIGNGIFTPNFEQEFSRLLYSSGKKKEYKRSRT